MLVVSLCAIASVTIRTSCGTFTSTLSEEEYYNSGQDDGRGYDEYLKDINEDKCGVRVLPKVFDIVEL